MVKSSNLGFQIQRAAGSNYLETLESKPRQHHRSHREVPFGVIDSIALGRIRLKHTAQGSEILHAIGQHLERRFVITTVLV